MTPDQENQMRNALLNKSVKELIDIIIADQDELLEAKQLRRRFMQIRNLVLNQDERRKPGRPKKE